MPPRRPETVRAASFQSPVHRPLHHVLIVTNFKLVFDRHPDWPLQRRALFEKRRSEMSLSVSLERFFIKIEIEIEVKRSQNKNSIPVYLSQGRIPLGVWNPNFVIPLLGAIQT